MYADRVINQVSPSETLLTTMKNGDTVLRSGKYRQRYSPTDKALYREYLYEGQWYIGITELDATNDALMLAGGTYTLSPVQEL